jgi:hypothetical protein
MILIVTVACIATAQASTAPPTPPKVLVVVREEIKPGNMDEHEREAMRYVATQAKANGRMPADMRQGRIAMSPIGGNENEVMYISPYDSMEQLEKVQRATEKLSTGIMKADFEAVSSSELHTAQNDMIAGYRPDLSYGIGKVDIAEARYMAMTTLRLKPGTEDEYWEKVKKITWAARDKTNFPGSFAVFEVRSGAPATTFLIFRPIKSLAELDTPAEALRNAMGEGGRKELDNIREKAVVHANPVLYMFNPRMSLVSPEMAARDKSSPSFWITNPQMPAASTTTTTATKRKPKQ